MTRTVRLSGILMLTAAVSACEYKALENPELLLEVSYDWSSCTPAENMAFRLLPPDGSAPSASCVLNGEKGGTLKVTDGTFLALSYTGGAENVLSRNETVSSYELYTPDFTDFSSLGKRTSELSPASGTESEPVVMIPGRVCTDVKEASFNMQSNPYPSLVFSPRDIMTDVEVKVLDIAGADVIDKVAATLSGMSGSFFPVAGTPAAAPSTLPVEFSTFDREAGSLSSSFCCFGDCTACAGNFIVIYVVKSDGTLVKYTQEVTDQVLAGSPSRHIVIEVKFLDIDGSTFNPSVGGWAEINKDIDL